MYECTPERGVPHVTSCDVVAAGQLLASLMEIPLEEVEEAILRRSVLPVRVEREMVIGVYAGCVIEYVT
jgi:hypothetical protein